MMAKLTKLEILKLELAEELIYHEEIIQLLKRSDNLLVKIRSKINIEEQKLQDETNEKI